MIKQKIKNWIQKELGVTSDFSVEHPKEMDHGDYAVNIAMVEYRKFALEVENGVKTMAWINKPKIPKELANRFIEILEKNKLPEIEKLEVAGPGFINIYLKPEFFGEVVAESLQSEEKFGSNDDLEGKKFFIEHTQPNPFKEFHIGHLMNNAIGESIVRIVRANGAEIKTSSYHGDVGLHVAKAVWALQKNGEKPVSALIGKAYSEGNKAYEDDEEARKEILVINKNIYDRSDSEINTIYDIGRDASIFYFANICKRLGSEFDYHFYESQSGEVGKVLILDNTGKVFEKSEGAIVFKGENFEPKTHTRVFINSEGLPTYEAKEVGLAKMKKDIFPYNFSLTVTANEQDAFFNVVEVAIGEVFPELKGKLKHISHGLLKLPTGKMSSRTGSIISAETLLNQTKEKVLEKMSDREMSVEEKDQVAEIVAIGAIKYSILRQAIGGDIIFDFDKSLSFEGDSGPYLQYAFVRAQSVLKKSKFQISNFKTEIPENWQTTKLEKLIARFPEVVERAGREYAPHYIATYLIELAGSFNSFYAEHKIVDDADPTSPYRVALTESFAVVMKNGLHLLGIKAPDQM